MQDCEFAYIGDYLCWKPNNKTAISVVNISQLRDSANIGIGLSLKSSQAAQDINALTIDMSDFIKPGCEHLVTLDRCNVCQRLKQNSRRFFDEATQAHFENSLQVTV